MTWLEWWLSDCWPYLVLGAALGYLIESRREHYTDPDQERYLGL